MFRVKKPVTVNKTIRLPETLVMQLETLASKNDVSFNQLVVQCCEYALDNLTTDQDETFKLEQKKTQE